MVWYRLLSRIEQAMKVAGIPKVRYGALDPRTQGVNRDGMVFLIRGYEGDDTDDDLIMYRTVTFYLECWVREDSPDFRESYALLAEKEEIIDAVLEKIKGESGMIDNTIQLIDLHVDQKTGDMGTLRPLCGVQYAVTATVYVETK